MMTVELDKNEVTKLDKPMKVTLYYVGEFGGFQKIEGHMYEHGRKKYAQYWAAPYIHIKPKRKRSVLQIIQGYNPTLVIVEGWGHPEIRDLGAVSETSGDVTTTSYGLSFGEERTNDFNTFVDAFGDLVIADYRNKDNVI